MRKILIDRHVGLAPLSSHGAMEFLYAQNGHKIVHASDFDKLRMSEQIRLPCCDADKRFGRIPGRSINSGSMTRMNAETLPLQFTVSKIVTAGAASLS